MNQGIRYQFNEENESRASPPFLTEAFEGDCVCQYHDAYKRAMRKIQAAKSKILFEYQNVRQRYVYDDTFMNSSLLQTNMSNTTAITISAARTRGESKSVHGHLSRYKTDIKKSDLSTPTTSINSSSNDHKQKTSLSLSSSATQYKNDVKLSQNQSRSSSQSRNMSILHKVSTKSNKALKLFPFKNRI